VDKYLPLILMVAVFVGIITFSRRNRQRQSNAEASRREQIRPGTEVMTTSGLYGTVVSMGGDDTVLLSIAPGVEVKWALAALRDVVDLPDRYRIAPSIETGSTGADEPGESSR
jgi:preprotein translocase subunit YajC